MPIQGFPDREKHRFCSVCHQWCEPEEGTDRGMPALLGFNLNPLGWLIGGLGRLASGAGGDAKLFVCHRCRRRQWRLKLAAVAILTLLFAAALVYLKLTGP